MHTVSNLQYAKPDADGKCVSNDVVLPFFHATEVSDFSDLLLAKSRHQLRVVEKERNVGVILMFEIDVCFLCLSFLRGRY